MILTMTMMKMRKAWWVRSGRAANARCVTEELPCSSLTLNEEEEDSYGEEARFNNANHTHPHLGPPWMPAWGPLTRQGTHFPHSSTSCPKSPSRSPTSGDSLHPSAMCILISPAWEQSYSHRLQCWENCQKSLSRSPKKHRKNGKTALLNWAKKGSVGFGWSLHYGLSNGNREFQNV